MPETIDPAKLLRAGLLDDLGVLVLGASAEADARSRTFAATIGETCAGLGARVFEREPAAAAAPDELPRQIDRLMVDGAGLFAAGGRAGLRECLDGAWEATQAVANAAFIGAGRAGRIFYIAPPSAVGADAGGPDGFAGAARSGLENLARTLSIEWARYEITTATIAPGASTSGEEVAALCAYLASPAGAYFSGCQLDLRGTSAPSGAR
jgi:NAD(P)-dependent dehydrogenase (short-subunit alcohol dehydrogenase family)